MPLPVLLALAAKVAAPVVIAGAGKLYHGHKKKQFEADPDNEGKKYSVADFVVDSVGDLVQQGKNVSGVVVDLAEKEQARLERSYNYAQKDSKYYSDEKLHEKYKNSEGAEKAGYGQALQERLEKKKNE